MPDLKPFNAFGYVIITAEDIEASVTVIANDKPFTRKVERELAEPLQGITTDDYGIVVFGILIEPEEPPHISAHEAVPLQADYQADEIPEVNEVLRETLALIRADLNI